MPRLTPFDSPLLLGFDHMERLLDRVSKSAEGGYPPYNIEQIGDHHLRITLAVAGFSLSDLSVSTEDNQLVIRGRHAPEEDIPDRVFLHQGIAGRQFQRNFVLAEGIEVEGADLKDGLLHISLSRLLPEPEIRAIPIRGENGGKTPPETLTLNADPHKNGD